VKWGVTSIITSIEVPCQGKVFNLAVEEDETYLAEGVIVHNCRSIIVPIVAGETVDEADFITDAEVGEARALADAKFLKQEE